MDFVAIDVETANAGLGSICQIGVAVFNNGKQVETWKTLVDPEDHFDGMNVGIHGIDEDAVRGSPTYPHVYDHLRGLIEGNVTVSHSSFDKTSVYRANERYNLAQINCRWLDSARVVRRAWPEFAHRGYGLANVAKTLGINFQHHDAFEDALACGEVMVRAIQSSGVDLEGWFARLSYKESDRIKRDGDPTGLLSGERIVFTGALSITRAQAADLAARAGCAVDAGVTKHTTLLVVGDQDIRHMAPGHTKSAKYRKAESLIRAGQELRIVAETDFQTLVGISEHE